MAGAETFPSRPISIVVPFPAGGPTDTLGRILADRMKRALGQSVIIENLTGAAGTVGSAHVARSAPDGYTLILGHWQTHVVNGATFALQFDVVNDFEPVSLIADCPMWVVGSAAVPAKTLKELIAWLKENPGKATVGIGGVGGGADVVGTYFQKNTGTRFQFVPYRGAAPIIQDLLAGHIDLTFTQVASALAQVRSGQLKAYVVMAKSRWAIHRGQLVASREFTHARAFSNEYALGCRDKSIGTLPDAGVERGRKVIDCLDVLDLQRHAQRAGCLIECLHL